MERQTRSRATIFVTPVLIALNLVAFNLLISHWSGARLDLTSDRRYSISDTTRKTLRSLDEPVTIIGYFSKRTHPKLAPLVPQIRDLLDEYAAVSGGKLKYQIIDPGESSGAEKEAAQRYGVQPTPFRLASKYEAGIVNAYFALVIKFGDQYKKYGFEDLIDVQPAPDGEVDVALRNPEYDLTRGIRKVVADFRRSSDMFAAITEPVHLTAIITPATLPDVFKEVPTTVQSAVDELKKKAGDKLTFQLIDPSSSPSVADEVYKKYGARPLQLGLLGGSPFFLYGVIESGGQAHQIDLTRANLTAADVRSDIDQTLRSEVPGAVTSIGVVSSDPSLPPEVLQQLEMQGKMPPQMQPPRYETLRQSLGQSYRVESVDLGAQSGVPGGIDVLVVIQPERLDENGLFNLDQYLMRGGRVILCAGNYDASFTQMGLNVTPTTTGVDDWLAKNGITIEKTLALDDRNQPLPIPEVASTPFGQVQTWKMAPYPYLIKVEGDGLADRNIAGTLQAIGLYWASPVHAVADAKSGRKVTTILTSSPKAWTDSSLEAVQSVSYSVPSDAKKLDLAVAVTGRFKSYFAGKGAPAPKEPGSTPPPPRVTVDESPDTRLVVVGNSEFLSDFVARALGSMDGGFFAENLRFMENLVDWTTQDADMIAIRSRGVASRRLQRMTREAEVGTEAANYLVPLALVVAIGLGRMLSRRRTRPIIARLDEAKGAIR